VRIPAKIDDAIRELAVLEETPLVGLVEGRR